MPSTKIHLLGRWRGVPAEALITIAVAAAILFVTVAGDLISSTLGRPAPWATAACYAGPAAVAFGVYWAIARRL